MKHNYHAHTVRCGHAVGTEREYIETGIKNGLFTIGFSDHSPFVFWKDRDGGMKIDREKSSDYFQTLGELRQEYRISHPEISIPIGFEFEYLSDSFESAISEADSCAAIMPDGERVGIEYLILGQHFIPDPDSAGYSGMPSDSEKRLASYVKSVIKGLETGRFTYLAHPDLLNFTGPESVYEKHMREICLASRELQIPLG